MTTFDDREAAFEAKFAHDEQMQFLARMRRNRFMAVWASALKGETLNDTARNIEAMGVDIVVVRHPCAGAAFQLSRVLRCSVVNAGDGTHEHPTQGLLDIFTIRQVRGRIEGLKVALVGDVAHRALCEQLRCSPART